MISFELKAPLMSRLIETSKITSIATNIFFSRFPHLIGIVTSGKGLRRIRGDGWACATVWNRSSTGVSDQGGWKCHEKHRSQSIYK